MITASAGLSIGEFDEIGNHIKGLASDDATVVVGTVIDEAMEDSLRVTLVATGIGSPVQPQSLPEKTCNAISGDACKKGCGYR